MTSTPCDNCGPGWCQRHAMIKKESDARLCQTDEELRNYWDRQAPERRRGLVGTKLAKAFKAAGLPKERYVALKELLGLPPTCRCPEREAWFNKLHAMAKEFLGLAE